MFEFFRNFWGAGKTKTKDTVQSSSQPAVRKRPSTNSISIVKTLLIFAALVAAALSPEAVIAESKANAKTKPLPKPHPSCGSSNSDKQPCVAVEVKLPPECIKNFKIIRGNPATANTLLLGEAHKICSNAIIKCTNALIEQRLDDRDFVAEITVLHEAAAHNQHLSCEEIKVEQVDNCRGWNGPRSDYPLKIADYLYETEDLIKRLHPKLNIILNLPAHLQRTKTIAMLEESKQDYEQERYDYEQSHAALFKDFKSTHPNVDFKDFYSSDITFRKKSIYCIDRIQKLLDKINAGTTTLQIHDDLVKEYNSLSDVVKQYNADPQAIQISNRYMLGAIKAAGAKNDLVILSTGFKHLDVTLFENLDAAKISFAALNCTLG